MSQVSIHIDKSLVLGGYKITVVGIGKERVLLDIEKLLPTDRRCDQFREAGYFPCEENSLTETQAATAIMASRAPEKTT